MFLLFFISFSQVTILGKNLFLDQLCPGIILLLETYSTCTLISKNGKKYESKYE
jgi:hypothetical protein